MLYNVNMENIKETIANNISALRRMNGFTQSELSERLNYSDKAVSKWERGESLPDITVLKQLADLFGVTVDYLLTPGSEHAEKVAEQTRESIVKNFFIALFGVSFIWLLATVIFVYTRLRGAGGTWTAFIWAIPASCVLLLYMRKRFCPYRILSCILTSLITWTALLAVYLQFLSYNMWLLFILGIPLQICIILWATIKSKNK